MAIAAATFAMVLNAWQHRQALRDAQQAQRAAALVEANRQVPQPAPPPAYEASARQFLAERSAAWPQALRQLENVQVAGIQVQSIELVSADRSIRLEVTAPGHATAVEFLSALNEGAQGQAGDMQWVLVRSVTTEGASVRAQFKGWSVP